jgi:hypothetical protein
MNMRYGTQVPKQRVACGMTLIEMLCIIALVVCVIEGSKVGKQFIGHWYGYLLGGILGVVVWLGCIYGIGFLIHLWKKHRK